MRRVGTTLDTQLNAGGKSVPATVTRMASAEVETNASQQQAGAAEMEFGDEALGPLPVSKL